MEKRFLESWSVGLKTFLGSYLVVLAQALVLGLFVAALSCTGIGLLFVPAVIAGAASILLKLRRGQKVSFWSDFFSCFNHWWRLFAVFVVKWVCILIGFCIFIVPGFYLLIRWSFVFELVFDKGCGFKEAFVKSSEMTKGRFWEVFAIITLSNIVSLLFGAVLGFLAIFVSSFPWMVELTYYDSLVKDKLDKIPVEVS